MIEFLTSLGLFGITVLALIVLILANLRGVIRARNPRDIDRERRVADDGTAARDPYAASGTRALIDPADPADPRG